MLQSTLVIADSSLVYSLARVRNSGTSVFQSNACNLFFPGIYLTAVPASYPGQFALSEFFPTNLTDDVTSEIAEDNWERGCCCSYYRGVRSIRVFARQELTVGGRVKT